MRGPDKADVMRAVRGQWDYVLSCFVHSDFLNAQDKEGPCPVCGGATRFRYDNKYENGDSYCSHCEPGNRDGIKLIQDVTGMSFNETLIAIMEKLGGSTGPTEPLPAPVTTTKKQKASPEWLKKELNKLVKGAQSIVAGDPVDTYLRNRGLILPGYPGVLRFHPSLEYRDEKKRKIGNYEAMLAIVQDKDGKPVTVHRTYLQDGRKAKIVDADGEEMPEKKLYSSTGDGGAIRLFRGDGTKLAVCEGIETAFAVHLLCGMDVWAGIAAKIMKKMIIPAHIEEVYIFADNDRPDDKGRRAGQDAAHALKQRLLEEGRKVVKCYVPPAEGTDWLDYYLAKQRQAPRVHAA